MDMEGAGVWGMSSKVRGLHVQRACGWKPGVLKKARKIKRQEFMNGAKGKERREEARGPAGLGCPGP